jgi:hypothetical protein
MDVKKLTAIFLVVAALVAAGLYVKARTSDKPEYGFLAGATLFERVVKDPRYGGGQRTVYQIAGSAEEVRKRIESELRANAVSKNRSFSIYRDGETLIYVGQGRAPKWEDYIKEAQSWGSDQASQEMHQKYLYLKDDPSTVAIAIDRPLLKPVEKGATEVARAVAPPPKKSPATTFQPSLTRKGKDVVLKLSYNNSGDGVQGLIVVQKVSLGEKQPESGLPFRIANLKPGGTGSIDLLFKNAAPGEVKFRIEYEEQFVIDGKPEMVDSFFERSIIVPAQK